MKKKISILTIFTFLFKNIRQISPRIQYSNEEMSLLHKVFNKMDEEEIVNNLAQQIVNILKQSNNKEREVFEERRDEEEKKESIK